MEAASKRHSRLSMGAKRNHEGPSNMPDRSESPRILPRLRKAGGFRLASSVLVFVVASVVLALVSTPTASAPVPTLEIDQEPAGKLELSVKAAASKTSKKGKGISKLSSAKGSKKTPKAPPAKSKDKKRATPPPSAKTQGKGKKKSPSPVPSPVSTPSPDLGGISDPTKRWPRIAAKLLAMGYKEFVSRAEYAGFDSFAIKYLGDKNITLLVAPDKAWVASRTARVGIILHLMQFTSIYGYFTGDGLKSLPIGTTLPSTYGTNGKNRQYIFKVKYGLGGRPTDNPGTMIVKPNVYAEISPNGVAWIVHIISGVLSPMVISE